MKKGVGGRGDSGRKLYKIPVKDANFFFQNYAQKKSERCKQNSEVFDLYKYLKIEHSNIKND